MADQLELEMAKGQIAICIEALKTLTLINGAAAVATLTYLGAAASKPNISGAALPSLKPALLCYSGGVLAAPVTFIIAYVAQLGMYRSGQVTTWDVQPVLVNVGILVAVCSAVLFGFGSWLAADALTSR